MLIKVYLRARAYAHYYLKPMQVSYLTLIIEKRLPSVHLYADDTQLYLLFSPTKEGDDALAIEAMRN